MNYIKKAFNLTYCYRFSIIGFFVTLFFYNRTHLCIASNLPKLGTIEALVKGKALYALGMILLLIIYFGAIDVLKDGLKQYLFTILKKYAIQFLLYFVTILTVFRSVEYLIYGGLVLITLFIAAPVAGLIISKLPFKLNIIDSNDTVQKNLAIYAYEFLGKYGLIFGAAWFYTLIKNPVLMMFETSWNNFIKNQIVLYRSLFITLVVSCILFVLEKVLFEHGIFRKEKN